MSDLQILGIIALGVVGLVVLVGCVVLFLQYICNRPKRCPYTVTATEATPVGAMLIHKATGGDYIWALVEHMPDGKALMGRKSIYEEHYQQVDVLNCYWVVNDGGLPPRVAPAPPPEPTRPPIVVVDHYTALLPPSEKKI